jgi:hypothetical protein
LPLGNENAEKEIKINAGVEQWTKVGEKVSQAGAKSLGQNHGRLAGGDFSAGRRI